MPNGPTDVAAGAPNAEGYSLNGDGTVTDKVTGLMWQQQTMMQGQMSPPLYVTLTFINANSYCPSLSLGGYNDWRLPSLVELISIADYSPAIEPTLVAYDENAAGPSPFDHCQNAIREDGNE